MSPTLIAFCVLGILEATTLALEESPFTQQQQQQQQQQQHLGQVISDLNFDEPADKRAYTYVSEYKRLPVYNFGLGKRRVATDDDKRARPFSFGLGKRIKPYSFGLGKRNDERDYGISRLNLDYLVPEEDAEDLLEEKRADRSYNFGLGKRQWNAPLGMEELMQTGKRPNNVPERKYMFGLGKRLLDEAKSMQ